MTLNCIHSNFLWVFNEFIVTKTMSWYLISNSCVNVNRFKSLTTRTFWSISEILKTSNFTLAFFRDKWHTESHLFDKVKFDFVNFPLSLFLVRASSRLFIFRIGYKLCNLIIDAWFEELLQLYTVEFEHFRTASHRTHMCFLIHQKD